MVNTLILKLLFALVSRMPHALLRRRDRIARLSWRCSSYLRRVCTANGRGVLGPDAGDQQLAEYGRGVVSEFIRFVAEIAIARQLSTQDLLGSITDIEGAEHFESALSLNRGLIIATCHAGNFEVGAAAIAARVSETHVLFKGDAQGAFDRMRSDLHRKLGLTEAHVEEGLGAWMQLRDALTRGGAVLIQADRCMPGQDGRATPFLHGRIEMPDGPAKLARLSGSPIVPIACIANDAGTRLIVGEPMDPQGKDPPSFDESTRSTLAAFFSGVIGRYPTQWHILHRAFIEGPA